MNEMKEYMDSLFNDFNGDKNSSNYTDFGRQTLDLRIELDIENAMYGIEDISKDDFHAFYKRFKQTNKYSQQYLIILDLLIGTKLLGELYKCEFENSQMQKAINILCQNYSIDCTRANIFLHSMKNVITRILVKEAS